MWCSVGVGDERWRTLDAPGGFGVGAFTQPEMELQRLRSNGEAPRQLCTLLLRCREVFAGKLLQDRAHVVLPLPYAVPP